MVIQLFRVQHNARTRIYYSYSPNNRNPAGRARKHWLNADRSAAAASTAFDQRRRRVLALRTRCGCRRRRTMNGVQELVRTVAIPGALRRLQERGPTVHRLAGGTRKILVLAVLVQVLQVAGAERHQRLRHVRAAR